MREALEASGARVCDGGTVSVGVGGQRLEVPTTRVCIPRTCKVCTVRVVDRDVTDANAVACVALQTPVDICPLDKEKYESYAMDNAGLWRSYWKFSSTCFLCRGEDTAAGHSCNGWVRVHVADDAGGEHEGAAYAELRVVCSRTSPISFFPRLYLQLAGKDTVIEWTLNLLALLGAATGAGVVEVQELETLPHARVCAMTMRAVAAHYARVAPHGVFSELLLQASRITLRGSPVVCFLPARPDASDVLSFWRRLYATRIPMPTAPVELGAVKHMLERVLRTGLTEEQQSQVCDKLKSTLGGDSEQRPLRELEVASLTPFFRTMRAMFEAERRQWLFAREHAHARAFLANGFVSDVLFLRDVTAQLGRNIVHGSNTVSARA